MHQKKLPVLLTPAYFSHIWGGRLLKDVMNKDYPQNDVGESWEVSAHPKGNSVLASGIYRGMPFGKYYAEILGYISPYPLLIKLIGPKKNLSVQVHPSDDYAAAHENASGKTEAWYVISSPENGQLIAGVSCGKDEFEKAIERGKVLNKLKYLNCKKGDFISIDPGLIHALLKDVIVYEVQQNSDITYRIYDWGRVDVKTKKPRELHVQKAMDVINFSEAGQVKSSGSGEYELLADNKYFSLAKINFDGEYEGMQKAGAAYTLIEGEGQILSDGIKLFNVTKGDSFYAPFENNFTIAGKGVILKSSEK